MYPEGDKGVLYVIQNRLDAELQGPYRIIFT